MLATHGNDLNAFSRPVIHSFKTPTPLHQPTSAAIIVPLLSFPVLRVV